MRSHSAHDLHSVVTELLIQRLIIYPFLFTYESVYFIYGLAHLNNAPAPHSATLVAAVMILTPSTLIFCPSLRVCLAVSLSVSTPLIPAWAQLKQFSWPSAPGLWWQLFACEVPARGLHYALLKKTLFDLTRFYFEGPSLTNSHRRPLCPPFPLSS